MLGGVRRGTLEAGAGKANFEAFFQELGQGYAELLVAGVDVYKIFRCGMAHEYLIKDPATVAMLKHPQMIEPARVFIDPNGHHYFCVERYFEDFIAAARRLEADLRGTPTQAFRQNWSVRHI